METKCTKCTKCGVSTPEEARFCPGCGAALGAEGSQVDTAKPYSGGKRSSMRDNLIIVGVIVAVTVSYFLYMKPAPAVQRPHQAENDESPHGSDMESMMADLPNIPADYDGLVKMGNETMDMGNFPVAAECYKRALAISGSSFEVRTDFGACLHAMGLPERALEEFYKVLEGHPEHAIANYNLGIVYSGLNEIDSARTYWKKYLDIDPNGQASKAARSFLKEIGG